MPREKLILICQFGGSFVTKDDGSISYDGGEAHALDINRETLFDTLKLKLAEICNFEYNSLSMKYFLPGNNRTLITLSNDKDLKRMYDFYGKAITADLFVMGTQGFDREAYRINTSRETGIKLAEKVTAIVQPQSTATTHVAVGSPSTPVVSTRKVSRAAVTPRRRHAPSSNSPETATGTAPIPTSVVLALTSKRLPNRAATNNISDANFTPVDDVAAPDADFVNVPIMFDMNSTPADTVKKRRRTASWKIGANGPTIVAGADTDTDTDTDVETRITPRSRKRNKETVDVFVEADESEQQLEATYSVPWIDDVNTKDVPLEEIIASWKVGITGVGQDFKGVAEFRNVLQKYAIANRFMYKLKKNDTNRASGTCVVEGCSWKIHASWVPSEQLFRIKKLNNSHSCEGESWNAAHPAKNLLVSIIKDRLRDSPHQKPKAIAKGIFQDFGLHLNYSQVWRGIEDAKVQLQGSHKESYNQLPWFCEKMVEANPASSAKLCIGDGSKFQRLFISFHASIYGFENGCRPILFLDSTSLKSKYHEILLTASTLDGDDSIFPVSFAIVDVENDENWHWFLEQLKYSISTSRSITFVSDKEKGLMKSVLEVFENAHYGYSMYHLLENFMRNLKGPFHGDGRGSLPGSLLAAAHAIRRDGFKMSTEKIKRVSSHAYDWIMQVDPEYWSNAYFKGQRYNHITADVAELYDNWIEEMRDIPITQKVEGLRSKIMELIQTRQVDSYEWATKLTPSKEQKLREDALKARFLKVLFSSDTLFEVHDDSIHVVDTEKRTCSCHGWNLDGLPCPHVIAVFNCKGKSVYDYCPKYFTAESYRTTYSKSINPVSEIWKPLNEDVDVPEAEQVLPPTTPKPPPPPKEKINRNGEIKRTVTCTRCKMEGHNKSTCKEAI